MLLKNKKNFFIKTTKGNAGLSEKEARAFPFYILFSKLLKSSNFILPYSNFSRKM